MANKIVIEAYTKIHARSIAVQLFGDVPERIVHEQREELLKPGPDEVYSACALSGTNVVGICTGVRMRWYGSRHRIEMVQVVVDEKFRGKGIANQMMRKIAEHFATLGIEIVQISVESGNEVAIKAYEKIGFTRFGVLKDGLKNDGRYADEIMMAAPVSRFLS